MIEKATEEGPGQVLIMGAGFDSRAYQFSADHPIVFMEFARLNAAAAANFGRLVASINLRALSRITGDGEVPSTANCIRRRFEAATIANRP